MRELVETKLQKIIILIGGFLIFFRLLDVSRYDRDSAILTSIGILVLTVVLLAVLRGYNPKFHLQIIGIIKKHKRILIVAIVCVLVMLGLLVFYALREQGYGVGIAPTKQTKDGLPELPKLPKLPKLP